MPAEAPVPSYVQYPAMGIPILCGVGGQKTTAVVRELDSHAQVYNSTALPLYTLSDLPGGTVAAEGQVIEYEWGSVYAASLNFRSMETDVPSTVIPGSPPTNSLPKTRISLWAQAEFPRPFPFWDEATLSPTTTIRPTRVNFLPRPGLQVETNREYSFYWIESDVLYRLTLHYHPALSEAQRLASALIHLK